MKGKNNPTFLISWRSQRDLARSLGWKCTLMIWGGPALALLSLYALLTLTHYLNPRISSHVIPSEARDHGFPYIASLRSPTSHALVQ